MHARSWSCGSPQWGWPDDVDRTGTETASGYRYLPITQTCSAGYAWTVARVLVDEDDDEMLADASLIAVAPEMLSILKEVRDAAKELDASEFGWRQMDATYVDQILSGIWRVTDRLVSKAEGTHGKDRRMD